MKRVFLRWTRSTIARFVFFLFCGQLSISGAVLFFVARASEGNVEEFQRQSITDIRGELLNISRTEGQTSLASEIEQRLKVDNVRLTMFLLADRDGRAIAGNLRVWPATVPPESDWRRVTLYGSNSTVPEQVLVLATPLPDGHRLLVGRVLDPGNHVIEIYESAIFYGLLLSAVATLASAVLLGRILSEKLASIAGTAEAVSAGLMSERVPSDGSGDTFDRLGRSINGMLDRIDGLVSELRLTTDGLAHDLKSPLTRITTAVAHMRQHAHGAVAEAEFDRMEIECEQLARMLATSLLISRTEGGMGRDQFVHVEIQAMLTDIAELYEPVADDAGITLAIDAPAEIVWPLNAELVQQAIGNLIENVVRYAKGATMITLSARRHERQLQIVVADNGPGIPVDRRDEALRRFGRLDPARSTPGSGLGLALVGSVARLHGGSIGLEDNQPGLRVVLMFALPPPDWPAAGN